MPATGLILSSALKLSLVNIRDLRLGQRVEGQKCATEEMYAFSTEASAVALLCPSILHLMPSHSERWLLKVRGNVDVQLVMTTAITVFQR